MPLVHFLWSWGWEEDGGSRNACSQPCVVVSLISPCFSLCLSPVMGFCWKLCSLCWWTAKFFGGEGCSSPGDTGTIGCSSSLSKALWKLGTRGICSMFFLGIQHHIALMRWWLARTFCLKNHKIFNLSGVNFRVRCQEGVQFLLSAHGYPVFPTLLNR